MGARRGIYEASIAAQGLAAAGVLVCGLLPPVPSTAGAAALAGVWLLARWPRVLVKLSGGPVLSAAPGLAAEAHRLIREGVELADQGDLKRALRSFSRAVSWVAPFAGRPVPPPVLGVLANALNCRGQALARLDRPGDALAAFQRVVSLFGEKNDLALQGEVAKALVGSGSALLDLNRPAEGLEALQRVVEECGPDAEPGVCARARYGIAAALWHLDRFEESVEAADRAIAALGRSPEAVDLKRVVADALIVKGEALARVGKLDAAAAAFDEVSRRFKKEQTPALAEAVADALARKAGMNESHKGAH